MEYTMPQIQDIKPNTRIKTVLLVASAVQKQARNGMFWQLELKDATGSIEARIWFPLSQNYSISKEMGTRHRAALGMSENSDAVVVVVSEETGTISIAENGVIERNFTPENLRRRLRKELLLKQEDGDKGDKEEEKSALSTLLKKVMK